ncbi:MAG: hypothetical protein P4L64_00075 [Caulobacteraceae bacterium]|nr:hypothetical protein [Caulobacteraceae bacterium]
MTSPSPRARAGGHKSQTVEFRHAIERAEAEGFTRDKMVLRLTLRDTADLKRDPSIPVEDISFTDGVMRFLGVVVAAGGVPVSGLDTKPDPAA